MTSPAVFVLFALLATDGEAVSILTVENRNFHEHGHNDGWGEWEEWQPCSRSCGGGVTYMQRECLRPRSSDGVGCEGSDKMYTSCSIQDCPVDATDFRRLQCSQHNNISYHGQSHEWVPYTGEAATNPCELFCQPRSGEFFLKIADKVVDGTRCRASEFDVCVDGICEAVGCDMLLGSDLKSDVCGECDGDGTACYPVKRSITAKLPSGYIPLIRIPPGATQVHIYEKKASRNFLAVRDSGQRYILNGHWQINSSSIIRAAGSDLVYTKTNDRARALESIKINGPTSEMLYIYILVQDRNRGIEYEFHLPHGTRDLNSGENGWHTERWQECSAKCGGGVQKRKVVCKNNNSGERVPNYRCFTQERPQTARECNTEPCGTRWFIGDWEPCPNRCGGGVQTRQVTCIEPNAESDRAPYLLPDERCLTTPKPETRRGCADAQCPEWLIGEWSTCSASCGDGWLHRQVLCPTENVCNETLKPPSVENCNLGPCIGVDWKTTEWSECIGGCGNGFQTRQVSCGTISRVHYPESLCDATVRPTTIKNCSSEILCPDKPIWVTEEWSDCSVTCGLGIQNRRVVCALHGFENYHILPNDNCRIARKPTSAQDCLTQNCTTTWYIGAWGPCSVSCNGGLQSRVVLCVGPEDTVLNDEACDIIYRPQDSEDCKMTPCESEADELPLVEVSSSGKSVTRRPEDSPPGTATELATPQESERCLLDSGPGNCDNWTVYWYFNTEIGLCDRFWFGGCSGNKNRFETREQCNQICHKYISILPTRETTASPIVQPITLSSTILSRLPSTYPPVHTTSSFPTTNQDFELPSRDPNSLPSFSPDFDVGHSPPRIELHLPPSLCFLRKSTGPCDARIPRWYFDGVTGICLAFSYGGCAGNENNFANEENCVQTCGTQPVPLFREGLAEANTPPIPASIKPGRSEVYAEVGEMARLACMAEGSPVPNVTWRKLGQEFSEDSERSEVPEDHSLIISKITVDDQGTYECTASNGFGPKQTWQVNLIVKERLLIRETPSDTTAFVGEPAALRCRIHEDVLFFTWYKDGKKLQTDEYYHRVQPWGDLHILQAEKEDSGIYTCTAYSPDASQSASANLVVSPREQFTARTISTLSSPVTRPTLRITSATERSSVKQCKDYPEYANCNVVASKKMCHKHNYARYCCASCGGEPSTPPPQSTRRRVELRRRSRRR